jgi:hypothetical protein
MPDPLTTTRLSPAPDENYRDARWRRSDPVYVEEAGTFWAWAWPDLLGWPIEITWLFSPVIGNHPWPGDLWGVDASGELIIVEVKASTHPSDPLKNFLELERKRARGEWSPHTVEEIRKRWELCLRDERQFLEANRDALQSGSGKPTLWRGVVPYSSKRLIT